MIQYAVDILEVATGKVTRVPCPGLGWHDTGTPHVYETGMCDCNLDGFVRRLTQNVPENWDWDLDRKNSQACFTTLRNCTHEMPPKIYKALRAHLADGRVVEL